MRSMTASIFVATVFSISAGSNGLDAQDQARSAVSQKVPVTELYFDLLADEYGTAVNAQLWGRIFQELGVSVRVQRPPLDRKPEIREQRFGTIRRVTVVGRLTQQGAILFTDRAFTMNQREKLAEWIRELKTYGAQGAPEGQPVFGLSKTQFDQLYQTLSEPLMADVEGQRLTDVLAAVNLSPKFPLRLTVATQEWLKEQPADRSVRQSLSGVSKGAALAVILKGYGLGFRPLRTPSGSIELAVDPLTKAEERWPIGWPLVESRQKTAPDLFKLVPINIQDLPLKDVLEAVSVAADVPILVDYRSIEANGIDISQLNVSYPPKKTSWSQFLRSITTPNRLTRQLVIDEGGRPLIWITSMKLSPLKRPASPELKTP